MSERKEKKKIVRELAEEAEIEEEEKESVDENIIELFKDQDGNPYATIKINKHHENWPIRSRAFENFITKQIYEASDKPPTKEKVNSFKSIYSAKALFEGRTYEVYLRCAKIEEEIFIDIADDEWRCIKINKEGIEILDTSPIKFRRFRHMKPLEFDLNANIKDIELLWKYVPVTEEDKIILRPHVALLFIPDIPYAIIIFYGPQGSGKSMSLKFIRVLVDPSSLKILSLAKDKTELVQQVSHHYLPFFDNVTRISKQYSDFFCRVVTGEGFSKRELYTDDEDIIYNIIRRLAFNGINIAGEEPDFLDRSVITHLERIEKKNRKREKALLKEFEKDKQLITGALLKIVQGSLEKFEDVEKEIKSLPRMADYAIWCETASQVIGEKPGVYLHKYLTKIESLNKDAIEANPIGWVILEFINDHQEWRGSPTHLLNELEKKAIELKININQKLWPRAPQSLTRRINEIKTNLEDEGIAVNTDERTREGRFITIKKNIDNTDLLSQNIQETQVLVSQGLKGNDSICDRKSSNSLAPSSNTQELTVMTADDDNKNNAVIQAIPKIKMSKTRVDDNIDDSFQNKGHFQKINSREVQNEIS